MKDFYATANDGASPAGVTLTERTLGNNQDFTEWQSERFHWSSEPTPDGASWPEDKDDSIALQPQRIRLFRVAFTTSEDSDGSTIFIQ